MTIQPTQNRTEDSTRVEEGQKVARDALDNMPAYCYEAGAKLDRVAEMRQILPCVLEHFGSKIWHMFFHIKEEAGNQTISHALCVYNNIGLARKIYEIASNRYAFLERNYAQKSTDRRYVDRTIARVRGFCRQVRDREQDQLLWKSSQTLVEQGPPCMQEILQFFSSVRYPLFQDSELVEQGLFLAHKKRENEKTYLRKEELCWLTNEDGVMQPKERPPEMIVRIFSTRDKNKRTPLFLACWNNHIDMADFLVENVGVDINVVEKDGYTPLFFAVYKERIEITKMLLRNGALPSQIVNVEGSGLTPLFQRVVLDVGTRDSISSTVCMLTGADAENIPVCGVDHGSQWIWSRKYKDRGFYRSILWQKMHLDALLTWVQENGDPSVVQPLRQIMEQEEATGKDEEFLFSDHPETQGHKKRKALFALFLFHMRQFRAYLAKNHYPPIQLTKILLPGNLHQVFSEKWSSRAAKKLTVGWPQKQLQHLVDWIAEYGQIDKSILLSLKEIIEKAPTSKDADNILFPEETMDADILMSDGLSDKKHTLHQSFIDNLMKLCVHISKNHWLEEVPRILPRRLLGILTNHYHINVEDNRGNAMLGYVLSKNNLFLSQYLLHLGCSLNKGIENFWMQALKLGNLATIRQLLHLGLYPTPWERPDDIQSLGTFGYKSLNSREISFAKAVKSPDSLRTIGHVAQSNLLIERLLKLHQVSCVLPEYSDEDVCQICYGLLYEPAKLSCNLVCCLSCLIKSIHQQLHTKAISSIEDFLCVAHRKKDIKEFPRVDAARQKKIEYKYPQGRDIRSYLHYSEKANGLLGHLRAKDGKPIKLGPDGSAWMQTEGLHFLCTLSSSLLTITTKIFNLQKESDAAKEQIYEAILKNNFLGKFSCSGQVVQQVGEKLLLKVDLPLTFVNEDQALVESLPLMVACCKSYRKYIQDIIDQKSPSEYTKILSKSPEPDALSLIKGDQKKFTSCIEYMQEQIPEGDFLKKDEKADQTFLWKRGNHTFLITYKEDFDLVYVMFNCIDTLPNHKAHRKSFIQSVFNQETTEDLPNIGTGLCSNTGLLTTHIAVFLGSIRIEMLYDFCKKFRDHALAQSNALYEQLCKVRSTGYQMSVKYTYFQRDCLHGMFNQALPDMDSSLKAIFDQWIDREDDISLRLVLASGAEDQAWSRDLYKKLLKERKTCKETGSCIKELALQNQANSKNFMHSQPLNMKNLWNVLTALWLFAKEKKLQHLSIHLEGLGGSFFRGNKMEQFFQIGESRVPVEDIQHWLKAMEPHLLSKPHTTVILPSSIFLQTAEIEQSDEKTLWRTSQKKVSIEQKLKQRFDRLNRTSST